MHSKLAQPGFKLMTSRSCMTVPFHVIETPALTTRKSLTFLSLIADHDYIFH